MPCDNSTLDNFYHPQSSGNILPALRFRKGFQFGNSMYLESNLYYSPLRHRIQRMHPLNRNTEREYSTGCQGANYPVDQRSNMD